VKLTLEWLEEKGACADGIAWWRASGLTDGIAVCERLVAEDEQEKTEWANWLVARLLSWPGRIRYAVYTTEKVLPLFEAQYPDDKRPRQAIDAAKRVLENDTPETRDAAWAALAAPAAAEDAVLRDIVNHGIELLQAERKEGT
jgi:hypothetical protein